MDEKTEDIDNDRVATDYGEPNKTMNEALTEEEREELLEYQLNNPDVPL